MNRAGGAEASLAQPKATSKGFGRGNVNGFGPVRSPCGGNGP